MSLSTSRSTVVRLQKDIADLRQKDAVEAKKEADLSGKAAKAQDAARRASSASSATSKINEANRALGDLSSVHKKRADLAKALASKSSDLRRAQGALETAEATERKKVAAADKSNDERRAKVLRDLDQKLKAQQPKIKNIGKITIEMPPMAVASPDYDVFISHASEDKDSFVRGFAEKLKTNGLTVFYDEMTLQWGDSLRKRIDEGLARSRFGVVVLSKAFFSKQWPQHELNGLVAMELDGRSRLLPIWHEISKDEVIRFSPTLADKLAMNTAVQSVDDIVANLVELSGAALPQASEAIGLPAGDAAGSVAK